MQVSPATPTNSHGCLAMIDFFEDQQQAAKQTLK